MILTISSVNPYTDAFARTVLSMKLKLRVRNISGRRRQSILRTICLINSSSNSGGGVSGEGSPKEPVDTRSVGFEDLGFSLSSWRSGIYSFLDRISNC